MVVTTPTGLVVAGVLVGVVVGTVVGVQCPVDISWVVSTKVVVSQNGVVVSGSVVVGAVVGVQCPVDISSVVGL